MSPSIPIQFTSIKNNLILDISVDCTEMSFPKIELQHIYKLPHSIDWQRNILIFKILNKNSPVPQVGSNTFENITISFCFFDN